MQYVRSLGGSLSSTWNSINPATLSGAIDVIVIEQEDGTLACSPFHVRFGKFSLLRPLEKKVEFKVNDVKQDYAMKLGEGGEAFFVFETSENVPESLQTSPIISPATSPSSASLEQGTTGLPEPTYLDITSDGRKAKSTNVSPQTSLDPLIVRDAIIDDGLQQTPTQFSGSWPGDKAIVPSPLERSASEEIYPVTPKVIDSFEGDRYLKDPLTLKRTEDEEPAEVQHDATSEHPKDPYERALSLSQKLAESNIQSHVTEAGDLMLDTTNYHDSEDQALRAEVVARKLLSDELEGHYDIGSLIGTDQRGNLWIYSSEEAKEAANRKTNYDPLSSSTYLNNDAASDPGYHSDSDQETVEPSSPTGHHRSQSDVVAETTKDTSELNHHYAKTLRLTSDQLKQLNLKPGSNSMSFTVNRATCGAYMWYWSHSTPIVISDIDGTITKSDALGHVLNMIGRDWTHIGVAKLYTDIVANGYNILYLTSRSVGQADTTRTYLWGVNQEGYRLPKGPVIMSPDRTIAALRREIYLRKPEVFKMACLRDILGLFPGRTNPFYAGFGNRFTDALSYRAVNVPSSRIFTINSNAEVSLDLLNLNKYKTSYVSIREVVDHFFPPVSMLVKEGGEEFTDFNYWRDTPQGLDDFRASDSEDEEEEEASTQDEELHGDLGESYLSRDSIDQSNMGDSMMETLDINDPNAESGIPEDELDMEGEDDEEDPSLMEDARTPKADESDLLRVLSTDSIREVRSPQPADWR